MNEQNSTQANAPEIRTEPRCTCCGYTGKWKVAPILRKKDIVIGLVLMILGFVPGLVFLGVTAAIRSDEKNREKICPKCNAQNLWTFTY